jgi:hypothetical protein
MEEDDKYKEFVEDNNWDEKQPLHFGSEEDERLWADGLIFCLIRTQRSNNDDSNNNNDGDGSNNEDIVNLVDSDDVRKDDRLQIRTDDFGTKQLSERNNIVMMKERYIRCECTTEGRFHH